MMKTRPQKIKRPQRIRKGAEISEIEGSPKPQDILPTRALRAVGEPATTLWQKKGTSRSSTQEPPTILAQDISGESKEDEAQKEYSQKKTFLSFLAETDWKRFLSKEVAIGGLIGAGIAVLSFIFFSHNITKSSEVKRDGTLESSSYAGRGVEKTKTKTKQKQSKHARPAPKAAVSESLKREAEGNTAEMNRDLHHLELRALTAVKDGDLKKAIRSYRSLAKRSGNQNSFQEIAALLSQAQKGACLTLPSGDTCEEEK